MSMTIVKTPEKRNDEIEEVLRQPKFSAIIDSLSPDSTFLLDILPYKNMVDYYTEDVETFMTSLKKCILRIKREKFKKDIDIEYAFRNMVIKIIDNTTIKFHDINPERLGIAVTVDCEIIGMNDRMAYIKDGDFLCLYCGHTEKIITESNRPIIIPTCSNKRDCGKSKMIINPKTLVAGYIQTVILQEPLEESKSNCPVHFVGKIRNQDVGKLFPGDKKRLTVLPKLEFNKDRNEHIIVLDVLFIDDAKEKENEKIKPEVLEMIKNESKADNFLDKLAECYAPHIYGYKDIKKSILLQLAGGVKTDKRGEINIFLVGDPSMAKSELLKFGKKITLKSMYTSGGGASKAGLTAGMVKLHDGTSIARLGVYPLCHRGFAFVDEFDKMHDDDRGAMHEVMEQGTVSLSKAGIAGFTVPAEVSTLAAANPEFGKYDASLGIMGNVTLPLPLLSRFDLIWMIADKIDDISDTFKAKHVLSGYKKKKESKGVLLSPNNLMLYLNFVRELKPELSEIAEAKLLVMYKKMRTSSKDQETIPIGIRQLEALVRLAMAHAKLHFRTTVEESDVDAVIELLKASYKSFDMDIDSGTFDQMTLFGGKQENKQQIVLRVLKTCEDANGLIDGSEFITKLASEPSFSDGDGEKELRRLNAQGIIYISTDGKWKRA